MASETSGTKKGQPNTPAATRLGGRRGFWQAYQEFLREVEDLKEADIDAGAGAVFGDRDPSPGREFEW